MRVAGLLLALVLVTSCFVGGTFAKYVTHGGGTGDARVAKFGVTVTATGDVFAKEYDAKDPTVQDYNGQVIAKSVISSESTKDVVAPGTAKNDALTVSVTGTPEVVISNLAVNTNAYKSEMAYDSSRELFYVTDAANRLYSFDLQGNVTSIDTLGDGIDINGLGIAPAVTEQP